MVRHKGHPSQVATVKRSWVRYAFAASHGIRIAGERLEGGADPQRDGMALGVP